MTLTEEQKQTIETLFKKATFITLDDSQGYETPLKAFENGLYIWVKVYDYRLKIEIREYSEKPDEKDEKYLSILILNFNNSQERDVQYCSSWGDDLEEVTNSNCFKLCKSIIEIEQDNESLKHFLQDTQNPPAPAKQQTKTGRKKL